MCLHNNTCIKCLQLFALVLELKVGQVASYSANTVLCTSATLLCMPCDLSPGGSGGIPVHHQQVKCHPPEEHSTQPEMSSVWVLVLLLHSRPFFGTSVLPQ